MPKTPATPSAKRTSRPRQASAPATKADIDALKSILAEIRDTLRHQAYVASLPSEPIDDQTRDEVAASLANPAPCISHEELKRELGL